MKKIHDVLSVLAIATTTGSLTFACAAPDADGTEETSNELSGKGEAPPPSESERREATEAGAKPPMADKPGVPDATAPVTKPEADPACNLSVRCVDGACVCASGPNDGASCDGTIKTGAESCTEKCRACP